MLLLLEATFGFNGVNKALNRRLSLFASILGLSWGIIGRLDGWRFRSCFGMLLSVHFTSVASVFLYIYTETLATFQGDSPCLALISFKPF